LPSLAIWQYSHFEYNIIDLNDIENLYLKIKFIKSKLFYTFVISGQSRIFNEGSEFEIDKFIV
jgi:hypothetical protein